MTHRRKTLASGLGGGYLWERGLEPRHGGLTVARRAVGRAVEASEKLASRTAGFVTPRLREFSVNRLKPVALWGW